MTTQTELLRNALERIAEWDECDARFRMDHGSNGERDYYRQIARTALAQPEQPVPEGWKLVPVEPTDEMRAAARASGAGHGWSFAWDAMLAASPTPPQAEQAEAAKPEPVGINGLTEPDDDVHTSALSPVGTFMPEHGGFFHGVLLVGGRIYGEVTGPKAECEVRDLAWLAEHEDVPGARSGSDSLANTRAMAAAGSPLGLAAQACRSGGFDDWAVPARGSALLQHENLHPLLTEAEAFDITKAYRTSTQYSRHFAWYVDFELGYIYANGKSWAGGAARFVRRFPLNP